MSGGFDSNHVQRAFGRAAQTYAQHSSLQRDVEDRLLERLDYFEGRPRRVLDIGCGPGRGTLALRKRFTDAQIVALDLALPMLKTIRPGWLRPVARVCANALDLPLADSSVDLLFSNLCIQWIANVPALARRIPPRAAAGRIHRVFDIWAGHIARTARGVGGGGR